MTPSPGRGSHNDIISSRVACVQRVFPPPQRHPQCPRGFSGQARQLYVVAGLVSDPTRVSFLLGLILQRLASLTRGRHG